MSIVRPAGSARRISPSIRFIEQFLQQRSSNRLTGLLLGQLDSFNRISTTFGEEQSSTFCTRYTDKLRDLFPPATPIIRLSGRRFAVLASPDSMASIMDLAARITEESQPQIQVGDDSFIVDVTVGIAVHPTHASSGASLFRRAELALKNAREREVAYDIYRPDATKQQATLWKMESNLSKAIQRGELEVYYQPKVDLRSRVVSGLEALVRWRNPEGGFVPADDFVPLAETSGQIVPMTWLVFDRVRAAAEDWKSFEQPINLSINIAPQLFEHPEFYRRLAALAEALAGHKIDMTVELTEDSLLDSDAEGQSIVDLEKIRKLGIGLSIDDFGKGHSSLTYLKQIPASEIKIDKKFVESIATDTADQQIVKAVVELSHALGMKVVAEGVDCIENFSVIAALGCDVAQGFYIARPMRPDLVFEWIACYSDSAVLRATPPSLLPEEPAKLN
jgi:predicted signal transduction protein with EAL and GGDEF domain